MRIAFGVRAYGPYTLVLCKGLRSSPIALAILHLIVLVLGAEPLTITTYIALYIGAAPQYMGLYNRAGGPIILHQMQEIFVEIFLNAGDFSRNILRNISLKHSCCKYFLEKYFSKLEISLLMGLRPINISIVIGPAALLHCFSYRGQRPL